MKKILFILLLAFSSICSRAQYTHTYWVGTGSGSLTISGSFLAGSLIIVKSGTYSTININSLSSVTIMNDSAGACVISGFGNGLNYSSCNNIHVTRNPTIASTTPYGFVHQSNTYRASSISGTCNWDTLEWVSYLSVGDIAINYTGTAPIWNGTDATVQSQGLCFQNCLFDSLGYLAVAFDNGTLTDSSITGLNRYMEISHCIFRYCDGGDIVFAQPSDKYKIHDNQFINCNPTNNDDNGLFHMVGTGSFYRNYAKDCQGHFIRMWTIAFGATPYTDSVYNNIYIGSRKYSMFEYQSILGANIPNAPNTTYTNVLINNNTCGNLNYQQNTSFGAFLVDNYAMSSSATIQIHNNLVFNTDNLGASNHIYQFGQGGTDSSHNWYFTNSALAGFDTVALYLLSGSPALNAGVTGSLLNATDFHSSPFGSIPSIGAVAGLAPALVPPYIIYRRHRKHININ